MRKIFSTMLAVVFAVALTGCGKSHDSIAKDMNSKFKELAGVLKGVTSEATAKEAAPKVKSIADDLAQLKKADDALPKQTPEESAKTLSSQPDIIPTMLEVATQSSRIHMDAKLSAAMGDSLKALDGAMK